MESVNKNILHLDKISKKNRDAVNKDVSEVLSLMQSNEKAAEIQVLKDIGFDHHIQEAERAKRDIQRFKVLEDKFGRKVYSGEQIKEYCESFGYQAIRVDRFRHEVPIQVGEEILKFIEDNSYDHHASETRVVRNTRVNKGSQYFFLLTSIQSINGAPVKHATLFYREDYQHSDYNVLKKHDMLIEVASWGMKGSERPLLWYYLKGSPIALFTIFAFLFISVICLLFGVETTHIFFPAFAVISAIIWSANFDKKFFTWNLS